jgi:hypothetical protein
MRSSVYVLVALAAAGFTTASAQNTAKPPRPAQQNTQPAQQTARPAQETVRPPDSARTNNANTRTNVAQKKQAQQDRVPPAMRGVGTTGSRPDCSKLRGIEKAECERRDTSRDDLPAGKTTTQPNKPPE